MSIALDLMVALLVLAAAAYVACASEPRGGVIGFIVFGLLLSLAWVRLSAVDVALTEAAIGGGATGLLLLRAAARLPARGARPGRGATLAAGLLCALVTGGLAALVLSLPAEGPSLAAAAGAELDAFGLGNPVTAVLLGYRALDTLLEKVVLALAVIGVWSLARDADWGSAPAPLADRTTDGPLALLARVLPPVGVVFGIYLVWAGADEPGGTFQGGAILAGMWLLAIMAGAVPPPRTDSRRLRLALFAGPALFIAVGVLGVPLAGAFLAYPEAAAKPIIVGVEAVLALSVAAVTALLVLGPAQGGRQ